MMTTPDYEISLTTVIKFLELSSFRASTCQQWRIPFHQFSDYWFERVLSNIPIIVARGIGVSWGILFKPRVGCGGRTDHPGKLCAYQAR